MYICVQEEPKICIILCTLLLHICTPVFSEELKLCTCAPVFSGELHEAVYMSVDLYSGGTENVYMCCTCTMYFQYEE